MRRAARCINEILFGLNLDFDVHSCVCEAARICGTSDDIRDAVLSFLQQRLLIQLKERGASHEIASLAVSVAGNRPFQALRFLNALSEVQAQPWFSSLVTSAVRVRNILAKEGSGVTSGADVSADLLRKDAEKALNQESKLWNRGWEKRSKRLTGPDSPVCLRNCHRRSRGFSRMSL